MIKKHEFLSKYSLDIILIETGYDWNEIEDIIEDYESLSDSLNDNIDMLTATLLKLELSVYLKKRIKDPEHLAEKIIRKAHENRKINYNKITKNDYLARITDLLGIRVIHTFKDDWRDIHLALKEMFKDFLETPKVYYREGDNKTLYEEFNAELNIKTSERDYRSAHYLVKQNGYIAEIQVRTIFEEAWGEVDHSLVYPLRKDDELLRQYSKILNRISGAGDEISSMMKLFAMKHDETKALQDNLASNINALNILINNLDVEEKEKDNIQGLLKLIKQNKCEMLEFSEIFKDYW